MENNTYGYVRVSTKDQNAARQVIAMQEFGIAEKFIFIDKQSGKNFNRPEYQKLMVQLRKGDTLVIKSIDRLGRNYEEIIAQWRYITKVREAHIVVLDMPVLDTRNGRDLIGTLISDIVLQLLSYLAESECEYIHQRQAEGIAAAKANGVKFGAKPMSKPVNYTHYRNEWFKGNLSARAAAKELGVTHTTFLKWCKNDPPLPMGVQSTKVSDVQNL